MLDGVILLWFILTGLAVVFMVFDQPTTPASPVLKWGFLLISIFTGPIGVFLYVLGCREPLSGLHEKYVQVPWRQVLGSTIHCVAGDGVGILAGAMIGEVLYLPTAGHIVLEYALGFVFGWSIFQAVFMRDMAGGSYGRALSRTFFPELLSMNWLMAGMIPVATIAKAHVPRGHSVESPAFWFIMSMALLSGLVLAYPMNWWLVAHHLKHGMITVRPTSSASSAIVSAAIPHERQRHEGTEPVQGSSRKAHSVSVRTLATATFLSFLVLIGGVAIAVLLGGISNP
jgi:Domain of unknown function (DUF4396)